MAIVNLYNQLTMDECGVPVLQDMALISHCPYLVIRYHKHVFEDVFAILVDIIQKGGRIIDVRCDNLNLGVATD